jgi:RES domain-containing protein
LIVFRICRAKHHATAFDGEGAARYPGRWNERGTKLVYCASSAALAQLECFVHLDRSDLPADLILIRATIPNGITVMNLDPSMLPKDWNAIPGPPSLQKIGSDWITSGRSVALRVPSILSPEENVLLNPAHADFGRLVMELPQTFTFDRRMWKLKAPKKP